MGVFSSLEYKTNGFCVRCLKDNGSSGTASITTTAVTNITQTAAISGGTVSSEGGAPVSARGVCWSTTINPTISDNHTIDGTGTGSFTSAISGLTANTTYYLRAYATNGIGTAYGNQVSCTTQSIFSCGSSMTINHIAGVVAPVSKTVIYGTVTNIPGEPLKCWITSNLGSDHQATSVNDATEASAGWYWQFNRKQGYKHTGTILTPSWTITSINEDLDWQSTNDPCAIELSNGWRIPTITEWTNVDVGGNWTNWNGPWNSGLKIHAAGHLQEIYGNLWDRGGMGIYWSSSQGGLNFSSYLILNSSNSSIYESYKAKGLTLRCVKGAIIPPSNIGVNGIIGGANLCFDATQTINVGGSLNSLTVLNGGSVTLIAGQKISFLPTTTVQPGGFMWGYIAPNGPWCQTPSMPAVAMVEDEIPSNIQQSSFKIYPNPTTGNFILEINGGVPADKVNVEIFGMWGEKVLAEIIHGDGKHEFSLANRPVGVYFIRIISGDKSETAKIIKQ